MSLLSVLLASGRAVEAALEGETPGELSAPLPLAVNRPALDALPRGLCAFFFAVPLLTADETLTFACADPGDEHALAELAYHARRAVRLRYAPPEIIASALRAAGLSTSQLPPAIDPRGTTDRPLLLVSRTSRAARLAKNVPPVDEAGQPTAELSSTVPRAPAVPSFAANHGARERAESVPAPTTRGRWAPATPFAAIDSVLDAMHLAASRDEVIDCLLIGMGTVARRVAVFACRKSGFRGVACNEAIRDAARLRELELPLAPPTVLGIAAQAGVYVGPLPATAAHAPLRQVLGECPYDVLATAVRVAGRPVVVVFADELSDSLLAAQRGQSLAAAAGEALSRVLAMSKSDRRGSP